MFSHKKILSRMVLCVVIFLSACNLNRAGIVWINDVQPQFVCPGDNVTLSWNVDVGGCLGDGCPSPVIVSISSDPAEVLGSPLTVRLRGEQAAGPITSNTTFTFSATGGADSRSPRTHDVEVVLPERETFVPLDFASSCSGSSAVWQVVDLSVPEFRADGVRLVRVCNTHSSQITLTLGFASGTQRWSLFPGMCTEDLPPDLGRSVLSASVASLGLVPPGTSCDVRESLPPPIALIAVLACDMMTASEPIVIATPETFTPEATQSGIIPLYTDTPVVPDSFILIVQVPANCRKGPGVVYDVVNSAQQGQQVQVIGKNADNTWWYSQLANDKCWISNVAGIPLGDLNLLPIIPAPPTPLPAATEEEEPTQAPEIDFDQDGYGVGIDCNDKNSAIHPNAVEIPDDKVDSNCNGDDDN